MERARVSCYLAKTESVPHASLYIFFMHHGSAHDIMLRLATAPMSRLHEDLSLVHTGALGVDQAALVPA